MTTVRRDLLPLALATPWAVCAGLRATGAERGWPLVPAMSFLPYAAVSSALPLGVALARRSPLGTVVSAAAAAVLTGATAARTRGRGADAAGPRVRVVSANLLHGRADPHAVLDLVRRFDADVLCLVELTPAADRAFRDAGLAELLPHEHVRGHRPGAPPAAGGAVWTRLEVLDRGGAPGRFEQPVVRLAVPGGPDLEVTAVHTDPPVSVARTRRWEREMAQLPDAGGDALRVLAGDFNATPDHASFRRLLARGYVDAAACTGQALVHTWSPEGRPQPRLTIDHVLVDRRVGVAGFSVHDLPGSDHRAVVAELVLPPG
ncbi:endonuclease/exonuclease/phosphatase family protein [Klenkia sp. LSe6-5]|uniref:Endonuclease/exonuclease/phosphatase family protein n=1 Tax=Klenkia sesuvii TaxID=3103137 RepID=A0ABU8DSS8_9ACTN